MSFVRIFVAWLVFAALPLQGFAAASMLLCDHSGAPSAAHEGHGSHGDHHSADHSAHSGADASSGPVQPEALHGQTSADVEHLTTVQSPHGHDDACEHACSVCASCHVMGLAGADEPSSPAELRAAVLTRPPQFVLTRAAPRPDKPPRA